MLNFKPLIVGITGAFGSGKSEAANFLKSLGFVKISLVQFLEEELRNKIQEVLKEEINE